MRHLAHFIVRFRVAIAACFIIIAAVCGLATLQVTVNQDMTQYLPANMQVKKGMDIMTEEFGDATLIRAMVKDVPEDQRQAIADDLADFDLVKNVSYEADSEQYNHDEYVAYSITLEGNSYSDSAERGYESVEKALESRGYEYWVAANIGNAADSLMPVYIMGVILAMIILFTLASSWIEPVLILFTILIAVLINMGTNIALGSISETTFSIGAILQMVLSMDYLIMLMNRYRAERMKSDPEIAMENALTGGVTAIASSSVTTVVGLLCLVFMSFTIGADLGVVLAKGVLLSLICVFAVQPALAIAADKLLFSTAKPYPQPKMKKLSAVAYRARVPLAIVFILLLAVGFPLRSVTTIDFVSSNDNDDTPIVESEFGKLQQIVVLYENDQEEAAQRVADRMANDDRIDSISSYATSVGLQYDATEMADKMGMSSSVVGMLYYYRFNDGNVGSLTRSEFLSYLRTGVKKDLGDMLDDTTLSSIDSLADLVSDVSEGTYTPDELAAAVDKHSVSASTVKLLYLAYRGSHDVNPAWTMSLDEITAYLVDDLMNDATFDSFFSSSVRTTITAARQQVVDGVSMLRSDEHGRLILMTHFDPDSTEMSDLCADLTAIATEELGDGAIASTDEGGRGWYLVGEGPMACDMAASFSDEFNFISILTIAAIFLIVLITFRSIAIPVILVALIQSAFCWDMILNYALGQSIFYLALIVVQSILMGATIDYAILYTTNYRESRERMGVRAALQDAYQHSVRTIFMSGGILVVVTGLLGLMTPGLTGKICLIIGEGALIAVILVLLVLPGAIAALDRLVVPKKRRFVEEKPSEQANPDTSLAEA